MLAQDCVNFARILLATPGGSTTRWTDAQLITLTDRAVKFAVARVRFPETRLTIAATPAGQQEYAMPEMHEVKRVYVNGQICVLVYGSIDTLEGRQALVEDQTGSGVQAPGSGGPPGAGGMMQPSWVMQTPVSYPFINNWGVPAPIAQPWGAGSRPRAYLRGGSIGVVPAPGASSYLVVEGVRVPTTLQNLTDAVVVPDNFMDAIGWKMCEYAQMADDSAQSADQRNYAGQKAEMEIRYLRTWKRQYSLDDGQIYPATDRSNYRFGLNRYYGEEGGSAW